jgi:hypothetical protein
MRNNNTKGFEMLRELNSWTDVVYNWAILIGIIIPLGAFAMLGYFAFMFWILGVGA